MTKKVINVGLVEDDGTGDGGRVAFIKVNDNFTERYDADAAHLADTGNPHGVTLTQAVTADAATNVSAAELESLTDTSDADALHSHSGADSHIADTSIHFTESQSILWAMAY